MIHKVAVQSRGVIQEIIAAACKIWSHLGVLICSEQYLHVGIEVFARIKAFIIHKRNQALATTVSRASPHHENACCPVAPTRSHAVRCAHG